MLALEASPEYAMKSACFFEVSVLKSLSPRFEAFSPKTFEQPAIRQTRITASLRALIHALPLKIAVFEVFLN